MRKIRTCLLMLSISLVAVSLFACKAEEVQSSPEQSSEEVAVTPEKLVTQNAVTDFSVSTEGVVSFSEENGVTYTLLVGGNAMVQVKSGDNVAELLSVGKSNVAVEKDARKGYAKSEPSNVVVVQKPERVNLALNELKLDFEQSAQGYTLVVAGRNIGSVTASAGLNVAEYLAYGANEIYVTSDGSVMADGTVVLQETSNSVNLYLHDKIDVKISANGQIGFEEVFGYTYSLVFNDTTIPVVNNTDISEILNSMVSGDNIVSITVTGGEVANSVYAVLDDDVVNEIAVKRYATPTNVAVTNTNRITFDGDTYSANLYVNGVFKSEVAYGDSIYQYFDGKNNQIVL